MFEVNEVFGILRALMFSAAGGFARLLHEKDRKKLALGRVFAEVFISGFSGVMLFELLREAGIDSGWLGLAAGIAGWTSPKILHALTRLVEKALGIHNENSRKIK